METLIADYENGIPNVHEASDLPKIKKALYEEELLEAERATIFTRKHWAGKIGRPNGSMFALLKKNKLREIVPPLKDENGVILTFEEDNLQLVFDFYNKIFAEPPCCSSDKTETRALIARTRKKVVPPHIMSSIDKPLALQEIRDSIDAMALNKTLGLDGLPNEFYKEFIDLLSPLLLLVWNESVQKGALPISIDTGVVKLIHKRGEKENLNNWRPITCLTSAYQIFALSFTRRISRLLDHFILNEQKGFIKNKYILDAIITLWEGFEYANDEKRDFLFFKVDFDKAYDRIEWILCYNPFKTLN